MPKKVEEEEEEQEDEEKAAEPVEDEGAEAPEEVESSLEELLAKRAEVPAEEEEESLLDLTADDRVESLTVRATPPQANEFVCSNCHLVKHESQLADRRRKLCRDCV